MAQVFAAPGVAVVSNSIIPSLPVARTIPVSRQAIFCLNQIRNEYGSIWIEMI